MSFSLLVYLLDIASPAAATASTLKDFVTLLISFPSEDVCLMISPFIVEETLLIKRE